MLARAAALLALAALPTLAQQPAVKITEVKDKEFPKLQAASPGYEVQADCDTKTLQQVALILEDLRRGFSLEFRDRLAAKGEEASAKLQVRFYRTQKALQANMQMPGGGAGGPMGPGGGGPAGYYDPGTRTLHTCFEQPAGDDWQFVLRHEATHQLLHNLLGIGGGQPGAGSAIWFNEGFASYWAMVRWKGKSLSEDAVQEKLLAEFKRANDAKTLMPLKDLIGGRPDPSAMPLYYAQGWALCRFLRHHPQYRKRFGAYLDCEREGKVGLDDFARAFEIKDLAAFETEYIKATVTLK